MYQYFTLALYNQHFLVFKSYWTQSTSSIFPFLVPVGMYFKTSRRIFIMVKKILTKHNQFNINSFDSFFKLVRIEHALMYALAVLIGAILVNGTAAITQKVIYAAVVAIFIEFGAFALNDYIDYKADKINRRIDRPLVKGEISRDAALLIGISSFIIANITALITLPQSAFLIILIFTILSLAYDLILKNLPFLGNFIIALTMAIPFFFGAYVYSFESNLSSQAYQPVL